MEVKSPSAPYTLGRMLREGARRRSAGLGVLVAIMILESALALITPWPMKWLIDHVLGNVPAPAYLFTQDRVTLIWASAIGTVAIVVAVGCLSLLQSWVSVGVGQGLIYDLSATLFQYVQRLSLSFHARAQVGDTLKRITHDSACVAIILRDCLLPMSAAVLTLVAMTVILLGIDWQMALLSLCTIPFVVLSLKRYSQRIADASYAYAEAESSAYAVIERSFASLPLIQTYHKMPETDLEVRQAYASALSTAIDANSLQLKLKITTGLITAIGTALLVCVGAKKVLAGSMSTGDLWIFLAYLASVYWPMESLIASTGHLREAAGSARRVLELLNQPQTVIDTPDAKPFAPAGPARLTFDNIRFQYGSGAEVLRGVSLDIAPGESVGLVGESGAGKTTLMSLIPRLFDVTSGTLRIDDADVRTLTIRSLRGQISSVLQRAILFPISIADNIAYARPGASRAEIEHAARAANAHEFIAALPDGYDTLVGDRGSTLSGGQKQRICIARALLHDAPILLLDEPSSALDNESETELLSGLRNLIANKTTLIIAHRLRTLKLCSRILVMHQGQIIEQGTHDELLARNGQYARLYRLQLAPEVTQ